MPVISRASRLLDKGHDWGIIEGAGRLAVCQARNGAAQPGDRADTLAPQWLQSNETGGHGMNDPRMASMKADL
jgi:hypothetical protein